MMNETQRRIEAVFRIEWARLVAGLARFVRGDLGAAEELAQDALVAALETWPEDGIPREPGAWLMQVAKNRALKRIDRQKRWEKKETEITRVLRDRQERGADAIEEAADDDVGDDLLRLVFASCHPSLSAESRVALTLRVVSGLTTQEIACAFVIPETTAAQRIVRAKKTLAESGAAFEVPRGKELAERLSSVLEVVYFVFNEGYVATVGGDWMRPALCEDALRLGRILAELVPNEAEVHGLVALMEIQASRIGARTLPDGTPIPLFEQSRARWDRFLIERGLAALKRGEAALHGEGGTPGEYLLQAGIAACHARARTPEDTDWRRIVAIYEQLAATTPSPIVELNRAVAISFADGPAAGLAIIDELAKLFAGALEGYHLVPAVRADFLSRLGRRDEARAELERAASLTKNDRERALLLTRAAATQN
ncbi:RNA polymerase sigma-70 factor, ECF subfamily [Labilithrix luteola]|uniref:RNA polymerase sigma factor n=1 Tax=Labilithrix luteola TaxID=1391654 RepID=A0A0K1Q469_9BACT|nr:RNA polymerase sigma factor [Labilithrix luteola]AKV00180.1 RNA polymerase sigma-70 factor, ECF subfamily [Labilithrix luteola]